MMELSTFGSVGFILALPALVRNLLFMLVGAAGIVGALLAATTREDAFEAGGRQSKWAWVAIVGGAALVCLLRFPFISWFGAVAIGVYFFDVRPHLNNIIRGNHGW
ncbi:DUF2516 family protein [Corynebacterium lipophiloflavum]|uniref:Uncharacterized protein n=1 Tax=Corynebacterium lipophiloflavum (strain ATCC 700352 / DSM 44291 / CCUG 37336 / JCM 10383 / DMMZ 1944) TaxID=525263 RepID=C0XUC3_CORLD|nr:DUF2516 family protein [Corynebacterium lipophiloflavum]EEI16189.1 hypothetical protein HMPREF0298_2043 [Corynebacterium lipophiloflavum DSM 44291]